MGSLPRLYNIKKCTNGSLMVCRRFAVARSMVILSQPPVTFMFVSSAHGCTRVNATQHVCTRLHTSQHSTPCILERGPCGRNPTIAKLRQQIRRPAASIRPLPPNFALMLAFCCRLWWASCEWGVFHGKPCIEL